MMNTVKNEMQDYGGAIGILTKEDYDKMLLIVSVSRAQEEARNLTKMYLDLKKGINIADLLPQIKETREKLSGICDDLAEVEKDLMKRDHSTGGLRYRISKDERRKLL